MQGLIRNVSLPEVRLTTLDQPRPAPPVHCEWISADVEGPRGYRGRTLERVMTRSLGLLILAAILVAVSAEATAAKLSGGPLEAVWFGGEPILQAISLPIVYAIDPASAVNHCRKNGKTLDVEIWNGLIGENTEAAAQVYFDSRIKPFLDERITNQPECSKPGLVYRAYDVSGGAVTEWNL